MKHSLFLPLAASLALAGCASSLGVAPSTPFAPTANAALKADVATPAIASDWWRGFGDQALNDLVEHALQGNPSLRVAQARLARVQAGVASARAADGVQVNGALDVTRQHFSATSIYPPPLGGASWTLGNAQLGASWDLDLFGRNRAAIDAALGTQRAAQAEVQAARVALATQVAVRYVELGRLRAQRELAQRTLTQREAMLGLIRQRVQSGLDSVVELRLGEAALPETRQQMQALDEQIALKRHALAALSAQTPQALDQLDARLDLLPSASAPSVLGADLLGRRADIVALRARVEAASSQVAGAKAQFYPNINLSAFVGLASVGLDRLVRSDSEQYGGGPALHLPLFDGGRLRANLSGKNAELDEAIAQYHAGVLDAVRDASDHITSLRAIARQQAEQARVQTATTDAYAMATQRYEAGLGGYLVVLNAETSVLNQRRAEVDLKARALETQIGLIRALGGGYADDSPKTALSPTP